MHIRDHLGNRVRIIERVGCRVDSLHVGKAEQVEEFVGDDIPLHVVVLREERRADADAWIGVRPSRGCEAYPWRFELGGVAASDGSLVYDAARRADVGQHELTGAGERSTELRRERVALRS